MRIIIMFDLPTETSVDLIEYRKFRGFLISNGFIMLQKSIYTKLAINPQIAELVRKQVRKHLPQDGLVQMLTITEKQFGDIELLSGTLKSNVVDSDSRYIEL